MKKNKLKIAARISLFIVSYLPLICIIIANQLYLNWEYLHWGGLNKNSIFVFIKYFLLVVILFAVVLFGIVGFILTISNLQNRCSTGGTTVKILEIENKNSESISYLFTNIIPFVFQDLTKLNQIFEFLFLMFLTLFLYINSDMILINPTISFKYSLFKIKYSIVESGKVKSGIILTSFKYLNVNEKIDLENVGFNLFFALKVEEQYGDE